MTMHRSDFIRPWSRSMAPVSPSPLAALDPYNGVWTMREATHLLKRLTFGVKPAEIHQVVQDGLQVSLQKLLVVDAIPSPPLNVYSNATKPDPDIPFGQTFVNAPINAALPPEYYNSRNDTFKVWWVGNLIQQNTNVTEKMTLFWHNHFATETSTVQIAQAMYQYYKLLRENCLGNFKTLATKITLNPAMLRYLNGYLNGKDAPDENYARELQELFTVGKGPDSKYTEEDVKSAAKVLTGYRINPFVMPMTYYFDFTQHDTSNKKFSSFYNGKIITGKFLGQGEQELAELIDMLFSNQETARHICRKLYRFFVYYDIDDTIETNVIHPLANLLIQSNFEVLPVLKKLFGSQHFFDASIMNAVIKNPLDYAVGICREFSVEFPKPVNDTTLLEQYLSWGAVYALAGYQGLNLGEPPVVAGWQAWYQQPQYHEIWINADSLANKNSIAEKITSPKGVEFLGIRLKIDPTIITAQFSNPHDPVQLVQDAVAFFYNYPLSEASYNYFKNNLVGGFPNDSYWGLAWNEFRTKPNDPAARSAVEIRLNALYREIMSQAEYHLS